MALVNTTRWSRLVLKVSQGGSPEVFAALCTINAARGINFTANTSEDAIPDCSDLEKVMWLIREKISLGAEVTGAGKVHKQDVKVLYDWLKSEDPINCKIILDDPTAANVITFTGLFHLTALNMNGDPGTPTVEGDISLASTGEIVATYGANVGGA